MRNGNTERGDQCKMNNINFKISGMHCKSCEKLIKMELEEVPGVSDVKIDYNSTKASAKLDPHLSKPADVIEVIKKIGYQAEMEE